MSFSLEIWIYSTAYFPQIIIHLFQENYTPLPLSLFCFILVNNGSLGGLWAQISPTIINNNSRGSRIFRSLRRASQTLFVCRSRDIDVTAGISFEQTRTPHSHTHKQSTPHTLWNQECIFFIEMWKSLINEKSRLKIK